MTASSTLESPPTGAYIEHHGRAMGTRLHIVVVGHGDLIDLAIRRVDQLEARWSRFIESSEVSRCNATRGIPVDVSSDTRSLVRHAIHGWRETNGAYDPTVLDALIANGYDRSYELIDNAQGSEGLSEPKPAPGCDGITVEDEFGTVTLPIGTGFDPGGIGKGLAADMIVDELMSAGASGVMVNLGGDLRVAGDAPTADGWVVEISEPSVSEDRIGLAAMVDGGLATSTTRRRVWSVDGVPQHHVIEPRIGRPVVSQAQLATVISGRAWWSEVVATQLLLSPPDQWAAITADAASLVIDTDGATHTFGSMKDHLR